jgi:hypothetical protein
MGRISKLIEQFAEQAGFKYNSVTVIDIGTEIRAEFEKKIGGEICQFYSVAPLPDGLSPEATELVEIATAKMIVERQKAHFDRLEEDACEDMAVSYGGKPWMNPSDRLMPPGHWKRTEGSAT